MAKVGPVKGLRKTTNLRSFRLYKGSIKFFDGSNLSLDNIGPKRAEITVMQPITNWIASTGSLLKALGDIEEIRANIADPEIMKYARAYGSSNN